MAISSIHFDKTKVIKMGTTKLPKPDNIPRQKVCVFCVDEYYPLDGVYNTYHPFDHENCPKCGRPLIEVDQYGRPIK